MNDWLATEGCDHLGHVAAVVVSELVTNAVIHGRDPVRLSLSRDDGLVRVEVFDGSTVLPSRRNAEPEDTGGRGLQIVESYSADWGSEHVDGGKVTWACIAADC